MSKCLNNKSNLMITINSPSVLKQRHGAGEMVKISPVFPATHTA